MRFIKLTSITLTFSLLTGCAAPLFEVVDIAHEEPDDYSISIDCSGLLPYQENRVYFNFINISPSGYVYFQEDRNRDNAFHYSSYSVEHMTDLKCKNPSDYKTISDVIHNNNVVSMIPNKKRFFIF